MLTNGIMDEDDIEYEYDYNFENEYEYEENDEEKEKEEEEEEEEKENDSRRLSEDTNFGNYILNQSSNSNIIELREINNINENEQNIINLTQFTLQQLESEEMKLKNSQLNTTVYSKIDEKGFLFSIKEIQFTSTSK